MPPPLRFIAGTTCRAAGMSRQAVSKWELSNTVPGAGRIVQMSRLFGITTGALLTNRSGDFAEAIGEPVLRDPARSHAVGRLLRRKGHTAAT